MAWSVVWSNWRYSCDGTGLGVLRQALRMVARFVLSIRKQLDTRKNLGPMMPLD